jgi:hypothetical protein
MRDDFIRAIRTAAIAGGMDREAAATLERKLRKEYGGTRVYLSKNAPTDRSDRRQRVSTDAGDTSGRPR